MGGREVVNLKNAPLVYVTRGNSFLQHMSPNFAATQFAQNVAQTCLAIIFVAMSLARSRNGATSCNNCGKTDSEICLQPVNSLYCGHPRDCELVSSIARDRNHKREFVSVKRL